MDDQVLVYPTTMIDGEVREAPLQMAQSITTKAQAKKAIANQEVVPQEN